MVDKQLVEKKLSLMDEYFENLKMKRSEISIHSLQKDLSLLTSVSYQLQTLIQASVDICTHIASDEKWELPDNAGHSFKIALRHGLISDKVSEELCDAVRFRNVLVHRYDELDLKIIADVVKTRLGIFPQFASEIRHWLKKRKKG